MSYRSRSASRIAMPIPMPKMIPVVKSMIPLLCEDNLHV